MKITEHFRLHEFTNSAEAKEHGIKNVPPKEAIDNIHLLCVRLLQPLRDAFGKPMIINSGYRCKALNHIVGGSKTSDHMNGRSADIHVDNPRELLACLLKNGLCFDQAILYDTPKKRFLHLSYRSGGNRRQVLYSENTKP